ncbi:MAG: fructosamine kinase family protein [Bacteroidota bacterium]
MKKERLESVLGKPIIGVQTLSGGDIAHAQKVTTKSGTFFVKSGSFPNAKELFEQEMVGLKTIEESESIDVPKIIGNYSFGGTACLILEFIKTKLPETLDMEAFGRKMAQFHLSTTSESFGFETDNFIGKLPQSNQRHSKWSSFYVMERLLPQLNLSQNLNLLKPSEVPELEHLIEKCGNIFGMVTPSLLHGDLWSGNYLISTTGNSYLIDPAVYYGHNEVDLAMTKLFGGFSNTFYGAYHEIIPPHENQKSLVEIYQLYFLLVHLNLFGTSYRNSVVQILKKYF